MVSESLFWLSFMEKVSQWHIYHPETVKVTERVVVFPLYVSWASSPHRVLDQLYFCMILGIKWKWEMKMMEMREPYSTRNLF